MTVVDRLNVAADERNRAVWADAMRKGRKTNVCWTIDNRRWKEALFAALAMNLSRVILSEGAGLLRRTKDLGLLRAPLADYFDRSKAGACRGPVVISFSIFSTD